MWFFSGIGISAQKIRALCFDPSLRKNDEYARTY